MTSATEIAKIPLSLYLWRRIRQLGTRSIMGVPGDMNLEFLDYLYEVGGLRWVGNANELNAAYAADGYARISGVPGVVVTTMGVGELSALNGVAGAFAEHVKLIHIVGTTATQAQNKRLMIHHNLGENPDHQVYSKIAKHVSCAQAWLDNGATAGAEIDRVLQECIVQSKPVYIFVPLDFAHVPIPSAPLDSPVDMSLPVNKENEHLALSRIAQLVAGAQRPVLLVDVLASRHNAVDETRQLAELLPVPVFSTPMGKTIINESHPRYRGIYSGAISHAGIQETVEGSDLILHIGPYLTDVNTGVYTRNIQASQLITVEPTRCTIFGGSYEAVYMKPFLRGLVESLQSTALSFGPVKTLPPQPKAADEESANIVQSWVWKRIAQFSRPGDVVIAESGTAQFGFPDATFPPGVTLVTQTYFGSIGYSVGCCLGAAMAQLELDEKRERPGRTILAVGDGSLQLSVQEIGTMIRWKLNPLLFIINNNGYSIERAIHGPTKSYNDISLWNHQKLLGFLGADNGEEMSRQVSTKEEMEATLALDAYQFPTSIQLLEVHMGVFDYPWRLKAQIAITESRATAKAASPRTNGLNGVSKGCKGHVNGINGVNGVNGINGMNGTNGVKSLE